MNIYGKKPNEGPDSETIQPVKEKQNGSFFRNALVLLGCILLGVLYFNDWNLRKSYAFLFGDKEATVVEQTSRPVTSSFPARAPQADRSAQNPNIPAPPVQQTLPNPITSEQAAQLEQRALELAQSEEMKHLTEESIALALESATEALELLDQSEIFQAFEALDNLDFEGMDLDNPDAADFEQVPLTFDQFSKKMEELGIDQFSREELQAMYDSGVSIFSISKLKDAGVLKYFSSEKIIELFNEN